jgi:small subunit ribosomal protein S24e
MKFEIVSQDENKLFDRKELKATFEFDGATPKRADIKVQLAGKIGAAPEQVVIRSITSQFGIRRINVLAHVYPSTDVAKKNEPYYILVREKLAEKKPKKQKKKATKAPVKR